MDKYIDFLYMDGTLREEKYYFLIRNEDPRHRHCSRENGPAEIYYNSNGQTLLERWMTNNKFHRTDGPAITYYYYGDNEGNPLQVPFKSEYWYINDKRLKDVHVAKIKQDLEFVKTMNELLCIEK